MRARTPRAHPKKIKRGGTIQTIARIKLPFGSGEYAYRVLGPWGEHHDAETRAIAEWKASLQSGLTCLRNEAISVASLIDQYLKFSQQYYSPRLIGENDSRTVGNQHARVVRALRYPWKLYRELPAEKFGPLALEACRELMIDDDLSRKYANQLIGCIQRAWKWASSKQLVSEASHSWLTKLQPLRKGRCRAREGPGTPPIVPWEVIQKTISHTSRTIAGMILTQYYCCMRPEEVCIMRKGCIIKELKVKGAPAGMWGYYPGIFKGDHLDNTVVQEVIPIGPKAQELLQPFLEEAVADDDYLFSPSKAQVEEMALKRSLRKTKVQPSQQDRRKKNPLKSPGAHYLPDSYRQAVQRATARAGVPSWSPVQLRHTHSTEIRDKYDGIDVAQLALRHKHSKTSEIYAKLQVSKAFQLMAKEG